MDKIIHHENYNEINNHNDIALVKTMGGIEYTNAVGPACLPFNRPDSFEGKNVNIFGKYDDVNLGPKKFHC